jgi:hypothetical protein
MFTYQEQIQTCIALSLSVQVPEIPKEVPKIEEKSKKVTRNIFVKNEIDQGVKYSIDKNSLSGPS